MKGRRKEGQELVRSLIKSGGGNSYSMTIPIEIVRKFGWSRHQKLQLSVDERNKRITIADWKK